MEKILEAGRWSPTAVNAQPQRILVLDAPESLSKVREFCSFGYDKKCVDLAEKASKYFRIGENMLHKLAEENPTAGWVILNGNRIQIKRKQFEKIIDTLDAI